MSTAEVSIMMAFLAGLLSFLSPACCRSSLFYRLHHRDLVRAVDAGARRPPHSMERAGARRDIRPRIFGHLHSLRRLGDGGGEWLLEHQFHLQQVGGF